MKALRTWFEKRVAREAFIAGFLHAGEGYNYDYGAEIEDLLEYFEKWYLDGTIDDSNLINKRWGYNECSRRRKE